jgi:predicted dehydrogenase
MHAEYTVRGLKAGKHVLCEKPMCDTVEEAQQMIEAAKQANKRLMIAYRLRYEPNNQRMIEMCRKQQYGPLRMISANNTQNVKPPNIRLSKQLGGGPVGDVGVYCINATRYLSGEEPAEVFAMQTKPSDDPRFAEVPASVTFQLRFPSGLLAHCGCGFDETSCRDYRVIAKDGFFGLDPAYDYHGIRGYANTAKGREELKAPDINQFAAEMDHMAECVLNDKQPLTPGEEGLADMKVVAAIGPSIDEGKVVRIG